MSILLFWVKFSFFFSLMIYSIISIDLGLEQIYFLCFLLHFHLLRQ